MERPRIRFRLDEHVSHAIARSLRRRGIDVLVVDVLSPEEMANRVEFA